MSAFIRSIATATPEHSLSQAHALRLSQSLSGASPEQARLLMRIYNGTRIDRRGVAVARRDDDDLAHFYPPGGAAGRGPATSQRMERYESLATTLGRRAAAEALKRAATPAQDVSHLVTVSCTGFSAPGFDIALVRELGLRPDVQRTHIGFMGCHGAINGLRVARALAAEESAGAVLLCCVELCSLHFQYGCDAGGAVAAALFADGAAAAVISGSAGATGEPPLRLLGTASAVLPDSQESMSWRIGDHGFEMTLAAEVPALIQQHLRALVGDFLGGQGLGIERIGGWAIHPGGPRVVDVVVECLGLPAEAATASSGVLARHGNMSSPTVLFILEALRRADTRRPWVAVAFGPGLAVELALIG